jgi:hypothetical protein
MAKEFDAHANGPTSADVEGEDNRKKDEPKSTAGLAKGGQKVRDAHFLENGVDESGSTGDKHYNADGTPADEA